MIKIKVTHKPIDDKDIGYDTQYFLNCTIEIPDEASVDDAMYGWFKALEIEGYSPEHIRSMMNKLDLQPSQVRQESATL